VPRASTEQAEAALAMQRAWRRFTFRQIFAYYRDTIQFREQAGEIQGR